MAKAGRPERASFAAVMAAPAAPSGSLPRTRCHIGIRVKKCNCTRAAVTADSLQAGEVLLLMDAKEIVNGCRKNRDVGEVAGEERSDLIYPLL